MTRAHRVERARTLYEEEEAKVEAERYGWTKIGQRWTVVHGPKLGHGPSRDRTPEEENYHRASVRAHQLYLEMKEKEAKERKGWTRVWFNT
jgi:hypothetical protein